MRIVVCGIFGAMLGISGLTHAVPVPGQGTWETTLLGRDINGHPISATDPDAVFAFDTVLNATWYLTANNTGLTWDDAKSWAAGLTVGTFSGWSLPEPNASCIDYNCPNSQMGELYYTALGNEAGAITNIGPFKNLQSFTHLKSGQYWSSSDQHTPDGGSVWYFDMGKGGQFYDAKFDNLSALAIRPGDILVAVPEPATYAMLLAGLFGVLALRRHKAERICGRRALLHAVVGILATVITTGTVLAAAVPGQGTWETTLLGRDINGHAVSIADPAAEFAYDTVLDATWYLTANDIRFQWDDAKSWASGLTVGTFSGWFLPAADPTCGNPLGNPYNCISSQMGELWPESVTPIKSVSLWC